MFDTHRGLLYRMKVANRTWYKTTLTLLCSILMYFIFTCNHRYLLIIQSQYYIDNVQLIITRIRYTYNSKVLDWLKSPCGIKLEMKNVKPKSKFNHLCIGHVHLQSFAIFRVMLEFYFNKKSYLHLSKFSSKCHLMISSLSKL